MQKCISVIEKGRLTDQPVYITLENLSSYGREMSDEEKEEGGVVHNELVVGAHTGENLLHGFEFELLHALAPDLHALRQEICAPEEEARLLGHCTTGQAQVYQKLNHHVNHLS